MGFPECERKVEVLANVVILLYFYPQRSHETITVFLSMTLTRKSITWLIIAFVLLVLLIPFPIPRSKTKIKQVPDGNTLVLSNGCTVRLIGVSSSEEGKALLESFKGKAVVLEPDSSGPFQPWQMDEDQTYYAYVLLKSNQYECLNAILLKQGLAQLVEDSHLTDSLKIFRKYAETAAIHSH